MPGSRGFTTGGDRQRVVDLLNASTQELEAALLLRRDEDQAMGDTREDEVCETPIQEDDELSRGEPERFPPRSTSANPPWVQAMQQSMALMHRKQDEVSDQMSQFRRELRDTQQRVAALEEIGTENGAVQRASLARIQALEEELQDLRRQVTHVPPLNRHRPATHAKKGD